MNDNLPNFEIYPFCDTCKKRRACERADHNGEPFACEEWEAWAVKAWETVTEELRAKEVK